MVLEDGVLEEVNKLFVFLFWFRNLFWKVRDLGREIVKILILFFVKVGFEGVILICGIFGFFFIKCWI